MTSYQVSFWYDDVEYEYETTADIPHLWNNLTLASLFEAGGLPVPEGLDADLFDDLHYEVISN
jgi:hypothetical protein